MSAVGVGVVVGVLVVEGVDVIGFVDVVATLGIFKWFVLTHSTFPLFPLCCMLNFLSSQEIKHTEYC